MTTSCAFCSTLFDDGLPGRFWQAGPRRRHEKRCARATDAERVYFRAHREWPATAAQISQLAVQRRRWKKAYRQRRRLAERWA